jgi:hypothetical protein
VSAPEPPAQAEYPNATPHGAPAPPAAEGGGN